MLRCTHCYQLRPDDEKRCQKCGTVQASYEPSAEQIAQACREIQRTWSKRVDAARRAIANPPAEAIRVRRVHDGRRRKWVEAD